MELVVASSSAHKCEKKRSYIKIHNIVDYFTYLI